MSEARPKESTSTKDPQEPASATTVNEQSNTGHHGGQEATSTQLSNVNDDARVAQPGVQSEQPADQDGEDDEDPGIPYYDVDQGADGKYRYGTGPGLGVIKRLREPEPRTEPITQEMVDKAMENPESMRVVYAMAIEGSLPGHLILGRGTEEKK